LTGFQYDLVIIWKWLAFWATLYIINSIERRIRVIAQE